MNRDGGVDMLMIALVISLLAHMAIMYLFKPQILAHINAWQSEKPRSVTKIIASRPNLEAVRFEMVRDVRPVKSEPVADVDGALLIVPETPAVAAPSMPEVSVPEVELAAWSKQTFSEKIVFNHPTEFKVSSYEIGTEAELPFELPEVKPVPSVEGNVGLITPVFKPAEIAQLGEIAKTKFFSNERGFASPQVAVPFADDEQIAAEISDAMVEREKAAVRALLSNHKARELTEIVSTSVKAYREAEWTYFSCQFVPKAELKPVAKDWVIMFDASGSIGNDRLGSCRKAARRFLRSGANTGDRFNLVAFRDRFQYAFSKWQTCDAEGFARADAWMSKLVAFGRTDLFASIASMHTLPRDPRRPLIALVITDGNANTGVRDVGEILRKFTKLNDGLFSVYLYGVKSRDEDELFAALAAGNRGESICAKGWSWNAGNELESFGEHFRSPVLTDLRLVYASSTPAESYPRLLRNVTLGGECKFYGRVRSEVREIGFSLQALSGANAYEGYFKLKLNPQEENAAVKAAWLKARELNSRLLGR